MSKKLRGFTGGEWKYLECPLIGLCDGDKEQWYLVGSPERAVGFIRHERDVLLIAAAPEMYDELYDALQLLKGKSSWDGDEFSKQAKSIQDLLERIDGKGKVAWL